MNLTDAPNRLPSDNPQRYTNPGEQYSESSVIFIDSKLDYEDVYVTTKDGVKIHG